MKVKVGNKVRLKAKYLNRPYLSSCNYRIAILPGMMFEGTTTVTHVKYGIADLENNYGYPVEVLEVIIN